MGSCSTPATASVGAAGMLLTCCCGSGGYPAAGAACSGPGRSCIPLPGTAACSVLLGFDAAASVTTNVCFPGPGCTSAGPAANNSSDADTPLHDWLAAGEGAGRASARPAEARASSLNRLLPGGMRLTLAGAGVNSARQRKSAANKFTYPSPDRHWDDSAVAQHSHIEQGDPPASLITTSSPSYSVSTGEAGAAVPTGEAASGQGPSLAAALKGGELCCSTSCTSPAAAVMASATATGSTPTACCNAPPAACPAITAGTGVLAGAAGGLAATAAKAAGCCGRGGIQAQAPAGSSAPSASAPSAASEEGCGERWVVSSKEYCKLRSDNSQAREGAAAVDWLRSETAEKHLRRASSSAGHPSELPSCQAGSLPSAINSTSPAEPLPCCGSGGGPTSGPGTEGPLAG